MAVRGLIIPVTEGFSHINQDMSTSFLDQWKEMQVLNSSKIITFCEIHNLKMPFYLERSELATILSASKSRGGFWAKLFTETVTTQKQEFQDKTPQKTSIFSIKKGDRRPNE